MSKNDLNQQVPPLNKVISNSLSVTGNNVGRLVQSANNKNSTVLQEDVGFWAKIKEFIVEFRLRIHKVAKIPVYWGNPFKRNSVF